MTKMTIMIWMLTMAPPQPANQRVSRQACQWVPSNQVAMVCPAASEISRSVTFPVSTCIQLFVVFLNFDPQGTSWSDCFCFVFLVWKNLMGRWPGSPRLTLSSCSFTSTSTIDISVQCKISTSRKRSTLITATRSASPSRWPDSTRPPYLFTGEQLQSNIKKGLKYNKKQKMLNCHCYHHPDIVPSDWNLLKPLNVAEVDKANPGVNSSDCHCFLIHQSGIARVPFFQCTMAKLKNEPKSM